MIGTKARTQFRPARLNQAVRTGNITSLGHAGGAIRKAARRSLRKRKGVSPVGSPPHSHTGRLKKAILYDVDKVRQSAIIGPASHLAGESGGMHEHGGRWKDQQFPKRPFMFPALQETAPRLPKHWAGSVR